MPTLTGRLNPLHITHYTTDSLLSFAVDSMTTVDRASPEYWLSRLLLLESTVPEYLVTYRNNTTGALVNVHITNVDDEHAAIKLADNSLLDDEYHHYYSINEVLPESFNSFI